MERKPRKKDEEELKAFNVRLTKEMWRFLKKQSVDQEKSMNLIITNCLDKYKENYKKWLTQQD